MIDEINYCKHDFLSSSEIFFSRHAHVKLMSAQEIKSISNFPWSEYTFYSQCAHSVSQLKQDIDRRRL